MKLSLLHLCIAALNFLLTSPGLHSQQQWRSVLYPENWSPPENLNFETDKLIQDFSYAGYRRGDVEIPDLDTQPFDVTRYGADKSGAKDSTVAIQTAIDAAQAAGGGIVFLPAGYYRVSVRGTNNSALRISSNSIVLRGEGREKTFIFNESFEMLLHALLWVTRGALRSGIRSSLPQKNRILAR